MQALSAAMVPMVPTRADAMEEAFEGIITLGSFPINIDL
jgi:hypothetical protein